MSYLETFEYKARQDLMDRLLATPLAHPSLRLGGTRYQGDGKIPSSYLSTFSLHCVTHEAGHMLDFFMQNKKARLALPGFGLDYPTEWVFDRFCALPTTTRAIHSECRATAIQLCLLKDIIGGDVDPYTFLLDMADTLAANNGTLLEDAYCIPRRRSETRRLYAENNRLRNRSLRLREQGNHKAARETVDINSASCTAYRQDRVEYVLKHCVKYYQRLDAGHLLANWQQMLVWADTHLADEAARQLLAA